MCDIQKLATLLRENVDDIYSGHSLLVLTVPVLQKLNESFVLINENVPTSKEAAVQVPALADRIVEQRLLDDLGFLLRLVRRTPGLRLVGGGCPRPGEQARPVVSVEQFHSLRHLVLHKVRLSDVRGLPALAPCLSSLCCDSDPWALPADPATWPRLRTATFCRAGTTAVPASLAAAAPLLAVLDLSRNRLSDAAAAEFCGFRSLTRLSLAYNLLEAVPSDLPPGLTALGLACNYVDTIDGVSGLQSLSELDLSGNCLAAHSGLSALSRLPALRWLDLRGNPLAFHPRHRTLTAATLHWDALTCEFMLDGRCLSQSECVAGVIGRRDTGSRGRARAESGVGVEERAPPVPAQRPPPPEDSLSTASSTASDRTLVADGTTPGRKQSTAGRDSSNKPTRKSRPVREAVISDLEAVDAAADGPLTASITSVQSLPPPDAAAEHLETKRRVETLREKFGPDWLHSQGAFYLQGELGLPPTAAAPATLLGEGAGAGEGAQATPVAGAGDSAAVEVDDVEVLKNEDQEASEVSCEQILSSEERNEQEEEEEIIPPPDEEEGEEEGEEREQQIYSVRRSLPGRPHQQEMFLVVTDRRLKERDVATGRLLCRWQAEALQSCELLSSEPARIHVTFDTVRPDRRERTYCVEDAKDLQRLLQTLRAILDVRPLQANNLSVFRCMKCSSQFAEEVESPLVPDPRVSGTLRCPNCGSAVVVQAEEEPPRAEATPAPTLHLPPPGGRGPAAALTAATFAAPPPPLEDPRLAESPSQSSIGSAASLDTSGEPSAGAALPGSGSGGPRRCESDIEIISNPSQSSIEVLDGSGARTPGRKRSSEERQVAAPHTLAALQVPPLLPTLPPPMTESSSSDSLTDSVCTAYEGRAPATGAAPAAALRTGPGPPHPQTMVPAAAASPGVPRQAAARPDLILQPPAQPPDIPQYSYTDFSWADHRIKLHLYVSVFQKRDEELTTIVKGHVLCKNLVQPKPALVVLSTHQVYLMYVTRQESDEPQRWLVPADSWALQQLREVRALPWGQGLSLSLSPPGSATATAALVLLLYDAERTSALLTHLAGLDVAGWCSVEREPSQQHAEAVRRLVATAEDRADAGTAVRMAAFFVAASIVTDSGTVDLGPGMLAMGESALLVTTDSLLWLMPASGKLPELLAAQSISNLVEVEVDGETLTPVFLDESSGTAREIRWVLRMGTAAVVSALLDAVRPPWEQLFSLPLQVSLSGQSR